MDKEKRDWIIRENHLVVTKRKVSQAKKGERIEFVFDAVPIGHTLVIDYAYTELLENQPRFRVEAGEKVRFDFILRRDIVSEEEIGLYGRRINWDEN